MPRHQIRNPSLLDPSRGSTASASLLAFSRLFPRSQRFSLSLYLFVSRERAHVKSLKGDEQTTRKPWGLLALAARLVQIFSLLRPCCRDSVCRTLFGKGRRGRWSTAKATENLVPRILSFLSTRSDVGVRETFQFRVDRGRRFHLFHRAMKGEKFNLSKRKNTGDPVFIEVGYRPLLHTFM